MPVSDPESDPEFVKIESGDPDGGFAWKHKSDVTEEDTLFHEDKGIEWEIADNGWWTITDQGEEVDRGRGEDSLTEALQERGIDR
jgi:hypothetical protein